MWMCVQARGHCLVSFSPYFLRLSLSLNLEPAYLASLSGQEATEIVLSLPPQCWLPGTCSMSDFFMCLLGI